MRRRARTVAHSSEHAMQERCLNTDGAQCGDRPMNKNRRDDARVTNTDHAKTPRPTGIRRRQYHTKPTVHFERGPSGAFNTHKKTVFWNWLRDHTWVAKRQRSNNNAQKIEPVLGTSTQTTYKKNRTRVRSTNQRPAVRNSAV